MKHVKLEIASIENHTFRSAANQQQKIASSLALEKKKKTEPGREEIKV